MSRMSFAAALLVFAAIGAPQYAQDPKPPEPEGVNIFTADGIKLRGQFYPSTAKNAPTVIMLHSIGEKKSMKSKDWTDLAALLQKKNYAVMTFDFRGHGESTTIDDPMAFRSKPYNNSFKTQQKDALDVKDYIKYSKTYMPVLVNDIAAVRAFLDRRNDDSKDCNTSSIIVIAADNSAALAALWINSEWYRYRYTPNPMFPLKIPAHIRQGTFASKPEGNDIIGAVFLSVSPSLEGRGKTEAMLRTACKQHGMAALFFSGKQDAKATAYAKNLEKALKDKNSDRHAFIGAYELPTELSGMKLLQRDLKTDELIVKYLDGVVEARRNDRIERDFANTYYLWKMGQFGPYISAKDKKGERTLNFDDYNKFIAQ